MRVAVFTLTRDRLQYTRHCFAKLRELAGYPFDHFVLDNGSQDGTNEWLRHDQCADQRIVHEVYCYRKNMGISWGCNEILRTILSRDYDLIDYDLILKFDNDCAPETPDFLARMVKVAEAAPKLIISPWVEGTTNKPSTAQPFVVAGETLYRAGHCGGLCRMAPRAAHEGFTYPTTLPYASGQDSAFSQQATRRGFHIAYMRDVVVNHYLSTKGQEKDPDMQEYFRRKYTEERTVPNA